MNLKSQFQPTQSILGGSYAAVFEPAGNDHHHYLVTWIADDVKNCVSKSHVILQYTLIFSNNSLKVKYYCQQKINADDFARPTPDEMP